MRGFDDLHDIIAMHVERALASRYRERHGLVTAYDPDNYLAKVMLQPEGVETDWLPIETGHAGNGFGFAVGLQTGDGKTTGDQVKISFHGGDLESGKVVQRVHSDKDKPPKVQSGEAVMWTKTNNNGSNQSGGGGGQSQNGTQARIFWTQDGKLKHEILDANGNSKSSIVMDSGSITHTSNDLTHNAGQNFTATSGKLSSVQSGGDVETVGKTWLGLDSTGQRGLPKVIGTAGPKAKVWGRV